jgi:GntR family transcriptional regulator
MAPTTARSSVPETALWLQVSETLGREIVEERSPGGKRLPSEAMLCKRFGVSRVTLRQALSRLEQLGLVHPQAGRGWYVGAAPMDKPVSEEPGVLQSFTEMARSRGLTPDSVVLHCRRRPADWDEAQDLGIAPGALLLSLRRLRRLNGMAVAVDHSLVPADLLPDATAAQFANGSLYEAFQRGGMRPVRADYEVEAVAADSEHSGLLGVEVGAPLLSARELCTDARDCRIERGHITYRGDRYRFRAILTI